MFLTGIKADSVRTSGEGPEFTVGTIGWDFTSGGPKAYIYVVADGTGITGDGYVALVDGSSFQATLASTTSSAPGTGAVRALASCAAYTLINTTGTAGALDDDASVGAEVVDGIALDVANGGATANTAAWLNWPKVGRTL